MHPLLYPVYNWPLTTFVGFLGLLRGILGLPSALAKLKKRKDRSYYVVLELPASRLCKVYL